MRRLAAGLLAAVLLVPVWPVTPARAATGPQVGDLAPNFTLTDLQGKRVSLSDYIGSKVVVLAFFHPSGPDLLVELERIHPALKGKPVQILGVGRPSYPPGMAGLAWADRLSYPVLIDPDGAVQGLYGGGGAPTKSYLIDLRGRIVQRLEPWDWRLAVGALWRAIGSLFGEEYEPLAVGGRMADFEFVDDSGRTLTAESSPGRARFFFCLDVPQFNEPLQKVVSSRLTHINRLTAEYRARGVDIVAVDVRRPDLTSSVGALGQAYPVHSDPTLFLRRRRSSTSPIFSIVVDSSGVIKRIVDGLQSGREAPFVSQMRANLDLVAQPPPAGVPQYLMPQPKAGDRVLDFSLPDFDGKTVSTASLRGQKAFLLVFWRSDGASVMEEFRLLRQLYPHYRDRGVGILAVNVDEPLGQARKWLSWNRLDFQLLRDAAGAVTDEYGVLELPFSVAVNRDGMITHVISGFPPVTGAVEIQKALETIASPTESGGNLPPKLVEPLPMVEPPRDLSPIPFSYDPLLGEEKARLLAGELAESIPLLYSILGCDDESLKAARLTLSVYADSGRFRAAGAPSGASGFARWTECSGGMREGQALVLYSGDIYDTSAVVLHELSHLLIHTRVKVVPLWLNEGIAYSVMATRRPSVTGVSLLRNWYVADLWPDPAETFRRLRDTEASNRQGALELANYAVRYIMAHYGGNGLRGIVNSMAAGAAVEQAIKDSLGLSLSELWQRLRTDFLKENPPYSPAPAAMRSEQPFAPSQSSEGLGPFSDVPSTHPAASEIILLTRLGSVSGLGDGTFGPDGEVTRAQFTKLLVYSLGLEGFLSRARATECRDVNPSHWASQFISVAEERRWLTGFPDGTFRPEEGVRGGQLLAIVSRVLGADPARTWVAESAQAGLPWYQKYVEFARAQGFVYPGFTPEGPATRAQCALALGRALRAAGLATTAVDRGDDLAPAAVKAAFPTGFTLVVSRRGERGGWISLKTGDLTDETYGERKMVGPVFVARANSGGMTIELRVPMPSGAGAGPVPGEGTAMPVLCRYVDGRWAPLPSFDEPATASGYRRQRTSLDGTSATVALFTTDPSGVGGRPVISTETFVPTPFTKTIGGPTPSAASTARPTEDGGFIVAGWTATTGFTPSYDAWLVKTRADGSRVGAFTFGDTQLDRAFSAIQTRDGGYVLAGETERQGDIDGLLVKVDALGKKVWTRTYGGRGDDVLLEVRETSNGGFILAGRTSSTGSGQSDAWLVRTDLDGVEAWSRTFGGTGPDEACSVEETADGGFIVAGSACLTRESDPSSVPLAVAWLFKVDAGGSLLWSRKFDGDGCGRLFRVRPTREGGYVAVGEKRAAGPTSYGGAWLINLDRNGQTAWSRTYGGNLYNQARAVVQTADGGYVVAGTTQPAGSSSRRAWLLKTGPEGNEVWMRTFGDSDPVFALDVAQTADGGFIIACKRWSSKTYASEALLIRTDDRGHVVAPP
jgi:peroxiredoxin